jgi:hypothetical protein
VPATAGLPLLHCCVATDRISQSIIACHHQHHHHQIAKLSHSINSHLLLVVYGIGKPANAD